MKLSEAMAIREEALKFAKDNHLAAKIRFLVRAEAEKRLEPTLEDGMTRLAISGAGVLLLADLTGDYDLKTAAYPVYEPGNFCFVASGPEQKIEVFRNGPWAQEILAEYARVTWRISHPKTVDVLNKFGPIT